MVELQRRGSTTSLLFEPVNKRSQWFYCIRSVQQIWFLKYCFVDIRVNA